MEQSMNSHRADAIRVPHCFRAGAEAAAEPPDEPGAITAGNRRVLNIAAAVGRHIAREQFRKSVANDSFSREQFTGQAA
jgi:hypothetical protein